ncbi:MAG TPA: signal peptide peptidase SppA [Thermoanaerobaculia bacterium]
MARRRFRLRYLALSLVLVAIAAGLIVRFAGEGGIPSHTVLHVDLDGGFPEGYPADPLETLFDVPITLWDVVETIDRAAEDSSVSVLVASLGRSPGGFAQTQELRDAILRFRAKDKLAIAHAETFGEIGGGNLSYYLASAFDEVWLQPSGDVGLTGLGFETYFLRGTLDKLGVEPVFGRRKEYKSAPNTYTERQYTGPQKEALEKLRDAWLDQMVAGIAEGRDLPAAQVRSLIDRGPFLAEEAKKEKLVDELGYRDEAIDDAEEHAGAGADRMSLPEYHARMEKPFARKAIALIPAVGAIRRGNSADDPILDEIFLGSDAMRRAFRQATNDGDVEAIVFRVDSPGGSYVASDTIWNEVRRAQDEGKPVVVSMGDAAASGGYLISLSADKIVAQPGTITGSIGVYAGKMVMSGLFDKIGVSVDEIHAGQNSLLWSPARGFSASQQARFDAWLDRIYKDFTERVVESRDLSAEKVAEIARGRVWSGDDAKKLGLVDEIGGLPRAVALARELAKIPEDASVNVRIYPKRRSAWEALGDAITGRDRDFLRAGARSRALDGTIRVLAPLLRELHAAGLLEEDAARAQMPRIDPR